MFEHPTGPAPEKVILVGLGPSKSEYMDIMSSDSVGIEHDEIWGVNGAGAVIKVDLSFAMDDYLTCVNRTPQFAKFFEESKEPVFTSVPRNPTSLAYPLQEVLNMPNARPYFNGSVSYIAAYAALIGVKELTIFGCDYIWGGVKYHPRQSDVVTRYMACMTYWLGYCAGRGMEIIVTPASPLLDADLKILEQFYGYVIKPLVAKTEARPTPDLPPHLGGHFGRCHTDSGALEHLINRFDIKSMLDIGCGTGAMVEMAIKCGLEALGIDGDGTIKCAAPSLVHDFTTGPAHVPEHDLAWSVEFLEHVEEQYMDNYMAAFDRCKYALVTFAPPGTPGHHHVNCQTQEYWIARFNEHGWGLDNPTTHQVRKASTMGRDFMRDNGLFFVRAE